MRKAEAEAAIRRLVHVWIAEEKIPKEEVGNASFISFRIWAVKEGYGDYFDFRSTTGSEYDAELWFDKETEQLWKK